VQFSLGRQLVHRGMQYPFRSDQTVNQTDEFYDHDKQCPTEIRAKLPV